MTVRAVALVVILALGTVAAALPAEAHPAGKVARVGFLHGSQPNAGPSVRWFDAVLQGLQERGWEEGRNLVIESRWAHGRQDLLDDLAAELVRLNVDVIVTDSTRGAQAMKNATRAIPIVLGLAGDPVQSGLVTSLARPGGNVTGMTTMSPEIAGTRLELLKEAAPTATRVAVLLNPDNPYHAVAWSEAQRAAQVLSTHVHKYSHVY